VRWEDCFVRGEIFGVGFYKKKCVDR
jgi:hypothetical protein